MRNTAGERHTARLETANGYRLTADGMIMAVKFLLKHGPAGGYYTPSMLMGARCVEQSPGSTPESEINEPVLDRFQAIPSEPASWQAYP